MEVHVNAEIMVVIGVNACHIIPDKIVQRHVLIF